MFNMKVIWDQFIKKYDTSERMDGRSVKWYQKRWGAAFQVGCWKISTIYDGNWFMFSWI